MMIRTTEQGYIAIMTVLVLLVFSLSLLVAVPYLSIDGARQALALSQGEIILAATEGCVDDVLLLSARDETYTGGTYEYAAYSCAVTIEKTEPVWTVTVIGNGQGIERRIVVTVERTTGSPGALTLLSWLEQ